MSPAPAPRKLTAEQHAALARCCLGFDAIGLITALAGLALVLAGIAFLIGLVIR